MQRMMIQSWTEFKSLVSNKKLLIQYVEGAGDYNVYASEAGEFMWAAILQKDGGADVTDFETNFKASANQPIENKADVGRPKRVATSPQPNDTTEKWKGFHMEIGTEETSKTIDISFDGLVYLKGGTVYSNDCSTLDHMKVDVVAKANPAYVIKANILSGIYMLPGNKINFLSSECMMIPSTVMLRVTYTKGTTTDTARSISMLIDYFETNA